MPRYWFEPLGGGMNQRVKGSQIDWNEAKFLYNMTHDRIGVWRSRLGNETVATGTGTAQGLGVYRGLNGDALLVASRDLYVLTGATLTQIGDSNLFSLGEDVSIVNFLDRAYLFSKNAQVRYTDGTSVSILGEGGNELQARFGAVAQQTLWVAGVANLEDRVYASFFDEVTVSPTDKLYEKDETFATSTRYFTVDGNITGLVSFRGYAHVFTSQAFYSVDIRDVGGLSGAEKLGDIGTSSPKSIAVDNKLGFLMWADGKNGVFLWSGAGTPINVAERVIERTELAVLDLIVSASSLTGYVDDGKYYLVLGDLSDPTLEYYSNACLVYDIAGNQWSVRDIEAKYLATYNNELYGVSADMKVTKYNQGLTDQDSNGDDVYYDSYVDTKDYGVEFGLIGSMKIFKGLEIAHKGTARITVYYSIDGDSEYTELTTIIPEETTKDRILTYRPLPPSTKGRTISFRFRKHPTFKRDVRSTDNNSGYMEIIGFGLDVNTLAQHGVKPNG